MKIKTTKKQLQSNYYYLIRGGYCEFQTLLKYPYAREFGYSCGVYGWNWDAIEVTDNKGNYICICTGYRDMTGKRIPGLAKFEAKARKIWDWDNKKSYEQKQKDHKRLINAFVKYVVEHYDGE